MPTQHNRFSRRSFFSTLGAAVAACVLKPFYRNPEVWRGKETIGDFRKKVRSANFTHSRLWLNADMEPLSGQITDAQHGRVVVNILPTHYQ